MRSRLVTLVSLRVAATALVVGSAAGAVAAVAYPVSTNGANWQGGTTVAGANWQSGPTLDGANWQ
jgi:hypothetical protein